LQRPWPSWLKKRLIESGNILEVKTALRKLAVNTVCEFGVCPNLNECFSRRRATFLLLGRTCSRSCGFCSVNKGLPEDVDNGEPDRVLSAIKALAIGYAVITSVTRDDLEDDGAGQFVKTVQRIRGSSDTIIIELLVPDFAAKEAPIKDILGTRPDIFGHNIETAKRLYAIARPDSDYHRSLNLLRLAKRINPAQITKSGMMVGLGEEKEEVFEAMEDLRASDCDILIIGQYLRPAPANLPVQRFVTPEEFAQYREFGKRLGFKDVAAGPFVRSSYFAEESYKKIEENIHDKCCTATTG